MNKEIEIPKGYEARIEGNKVIIVPIDSEDERIRKSIMSIISQYARMCEKEGDPCEASLIDDALAYLERQKEHLSVPDKFSGLKSLMLQYLQSAANRKDDTEIESDTDLWGRKILDYVWKHDEKQKEQKPAEKISVSEELYEHIRNTCACIDDAMSSDTMCDMTDYLTMANSSAQKALDMVDKSVVKQPAESPENPRDIHNRGYVKGVEDAYNNVNEAKVILKRLAKENPKPAEWSEEDDAIHTRVLGALGKTIMGVLPTRPSQEDIEWFKSLPERFNLQPKQEWSKEDERLLNVIIDILDKEEHNGHLMRGDLKACVKLLKSLRPQHITYALDAPLGYDKDMNPIYPPINHWKPTERQIAALEWQIKNTYDGSWQRKESESLYNDLKKL